MQTLDHRPAEGLECARPGAAPGLRLAAAAALWLGLAAVPAQAMTLGQVQGAPVLGQALRLRVPVRMDPGLPLVADCVRVELRDGEIPVPRQDIRVVIRNGGAHGWSSIDLSSSRGPRSAFLQLKVHMGCQFRRSRSYTLLVEPSSRVAQDLPERLGRESAREPAPLARGVRRHLESRRHTRHAQGPRRPASASHLRLDGLSRELAERRPVAPVAPGAPATPVLVATAAKPWATASAALAQQELHSPQASDAQLMQRIDAMQREVHALQARNARRGQEMGALQAQLARARSRPSPWLNAAFAAVGALAALLALLMWQARRPRLKSPWPAGLLAQGAPSRALAEDRVGAAASGAAPRPRASDLPWDMPAPRPVPAVAEPAPDDAPALSRPLEDPASLDRAAFQRPLSLPEHVQIDEVVDHGHLADFFIGIGDYAKAIEVMRRAVDEAGGLTSALPYLYLFDLYRRSGRRADYEQLMGECSGRLNVRILPWEQGSGEAPRDLLDYPRALALLTESWDGPARLTVIERLIADDPRKPRVGFDLPAYRDLLDLYALARELQQAPQPKHAEPAPSRGPSPAALDMPLALDASAPAQGARPAAPPRARPARLPARPIEFADSEAPTLAPLDFTMSTRPPQPWPR